MKFVTAVATLLLAAVAVVNAQVTYNNGTFSCVSGGGAYCASDSLSSNIIIRCNDKVGQPGNCNDNLAAAPPVGVKPFAPCYQSSPAAGDAACSWNCTAYYENGFKYNLPANLTSQCFVSGDQGPASSNSTASVNGTNLANSEKTTTLPATPSPTSGTSTISTTTTANATSECGTDLCTATSSEATSTPMSVPAGVTALTASESSSVSSSGASSATSMSDISAIFSSILASGRNATVFAISAAASSSSSSSGSSTGTVTTTTTLANQTIHLPTSSIATGSPTSTPAFTGAASSNMVAEYMRSLWALIAIPALLFA